MDGRKRVGGFSIFPVYMLAGVLAMGLGLGIARGQAMSKAAVDLPPVGPGTVASGPVVTVLPEHGAAAKENVAPGHAPATVAAAVPAKGAGPELPKAGTGDVAAATLPTETTDKEAATKPADAAGAAIEKTRIGAGTKADDPPADAATAEKPRSNLMSGLYSTLQVAGALTLVIGIIIIGRVIMKKLVPGAAVGNGKGVMETLARYPIGRNQSVVLLRIGSQIVALNQTKEASQSILVINEPVEVAKIMGQIAGADPNSIQANFNRALSNARMDLENPDTMDVVDANRSISVTGDRGGEGDLDEQLEEMAAAKRQLMELRAQVRSVRDTLPG